MKNQWAVLGGVRCFLASIVLFGHISHVVLMPRWAETLTHLDPFAAVLAFFLISGFSIAASLERGTSTIAYYERRVNRIYPVYLAAFALSCVPYLLWGQTVSTLHAGNMQAPQSVWEFAGGAFLLQGLLVSLPQAIGTTWTLGIECQLYALAPLLKRFNLPAQLVVFALSLLAFTNYGRLTHIDLTQMRFGEGTAFLGWAWLLGFVYYQNRCALWAKALLTGAALFGTCLHIGGVGELGPLTVGITVFALLFGNQIETRVRGRDFAGPLAYAGEVSYPLYVVHWPVLALLAGGDHERSFWLFLGLSFAAALLLLHGVDLPYRAYVRRRSRAATPTLPTESAEAAMPPSFHETLKSVN